MRPMTALYRFSFFVFLFSFTGGCAILGVAAHKFSPPETVQPKYMGLENQSTGVMVWADRALRIDWPPLQLDLANAIQDKLVEYQKASKREARTLAGTSFPVQPKSIVRYQMDHPEIEAMPIEEVAPRLGVNRLIYVEVQDFSTRSAEQLDLFRGSGIATVKLIEVHDGQGKTAFTEDDVRAVYPPKAPPQGIPGAGDARMYAGTVDALATEVARLFVQYQVEE